MHSLIAALFLAALWTPLIGMLIGRGPGNVRGENRKLAEMPQVHPDWNNVLNAPWKFNVYFHDHFGLRGTLIILQALLKVKVLGVSSSPQVTVGKHGWLFFAGDDSIESFRGLRPFSRPELSAWIRLFRARQEWLDHLGIPYALMIAPDKHTIYPENVPDHIARGTQPSRLDQLASALRQQTKWRVIDVRPALLQAKAFRYRLYHLTDTHWNGYGAFIAYQTILNNLAKRYPDLRPLPPSDCVDSTWLSSGDLAGMLGLRREIHERMSGCTLRPPAHPVRTLANTETLLTIEQEGAGPHRLVMLRDSFGVALMPLLSRHFARASYTWNYSFDTVFVKYERPDLVIVELVERRLNTAPPIDTSIPDIAETP